MSSSHFLPNHHKNELNVKVIVTISKVVFSIGVYSLGSVIVRNCSPCEFLLSKVLLHFMRVFIIWSLSGYVLQNGTDFLLAGSSHPPIYQKRNILQPNYRIQNVPLSLPNLNQPLFI